MFNPRDTESFIIELQTKGNNFFDGLEKLKLKDLPNGTYKFNKILANTYTHSNGDKEIGYLLFIDEYPNHYISLSKSVNEVVQRLVNNGLSTMYLNNSIDTVEVTSILSKNKLYDHKSIMLKY